MHSPRHSLQPCCVLLRVSALRPLLLALLWALQRHVPISCFVIFITPLQATKARRAGPTHIAHSSSSSSSTDGSSPTTTTTTTTTTPIVLGWGLDKHILQLATSNSNSNSQPEGDMLCFATVPLGVVGLNHTSAVVEPLQVLRLVREPHNRYDPK